MHDGDDQLLISEALQPAQSVPCWSCKGGVDGRAPFCHACGVIQPPRPADDFQRLGLASHFDVDPKDLEKRYFAFQRTFHPDRFATKTARERQYSLQHATGLNESYERLKAPLTRAQSLLVAMGGTLPDEAHTEGDPELLMEAMESREALAEADTAEAVAALEVKARVDIEVCEEALSLAFAVEDLDGAANLITRLKYLVKLYDEIRRKRRSVQG